MYNIKDGEDKNMNKDTAFKFRLKSIIKRLKSKGKWDLLSKLAYKYGIVVAGEKYYDQYSIYQFCGGNIWNCNSNVGIME